jgi:hypothetical protein
MTRIAPVQQIDLTAPSGSLTYVEILTPAGIVRVNTNLVSVRTNQPAVVIEVEPDVARWNTSVNDSRAEITLTRRSGTETAGEQS